MSTPRTKEEERAVLGRALMTKALPVGFRGQITVADPNIVAELIARTQRILSLYGPALQRRRLERS